MATVSRNYLPGYTGTCSLDAVEHPIPGWSHDGDPNLWDSSSQVDNGWPSKEAGQPTLTFNFSIYAKVASPAAPVKMGDTIPAIFMIHEVVAFDGNIIISKVSTKNDWKGGIMYDVSAECQGQPNAGFLLPTMLAAPTGGGGGQ